MKYNIFIHFTLPFLFTSYWRFFKDPIINKVIFVLFCFAILPISGAVTHIAKSGSLADMTAAYNLCVNGDTLKDTAKNATWTSGLTIGKKIIILGANCTLSTTSAMPNGFFNVTGFQADTLVRIEGFIFQMNNYSPLFAIYVHDMLGCFYGGKIRIDHNEFHFGHSQITFNHPKGLIDNNIFYNSDLTININAGSRDYADSSWNSLDAGTADAIFIENNSFIIDANYGLTYCDEQIGTANGSKLVVRYNTFDFNNIPFTNSTAYPFMAHGSADGGCGTPSIGYWQYDAATTRCRRRGQSVIEFYNNTELGKRIDYMYQTRGSANLVYNNTITGTVLNNPTIKIQEEEYPGQSNNWTIPRTAWPAEDQVHNSFFWNNLYKGNDLSSNISNFTITPHDSLAGLWQNRDFFLHAPLDTGGKEWFTGKNGASSSYPTDGKPNDYPTLGTMVFSHDSANAYYGYPSNSYPPYTYPHPLRKPTKPKNLTLIN